MIQSKYFSCLSLSVKRMLELQDVKGNPFKGDERIDQLTLKELQTYFRFKNGKKGTVSTFKELLERMHQLNPKMKMMIEIKSWVNLNYIIDEVIEMYKKYDLYQRASVGSFNPMVLYKLRARNPKIVTLLLVKKHLVSAWYATDINSTPKFLADMNPTLKSILYQISLGLDYVLFYSCKTWLPSFLGVGVLGVDINLIRDGDLSVETIQNQGYVVNVWVVNELKEKEELKQQKVAITTDYLF